MAGSHRPPRNSPPPRADVERVRGLLQFDRDHAQRGCLVGIDEAGRGPLAGPVVAAAVCLPPELDPVLFACLNDSKAVSEKRREALADAIRESALAVGVGQASPKEIDELDVEKAAFLAMRRALLDTSLIPDVVLVDGHRDPNLGLPAQPIVKGDGQSAAIAAASIIAKTTRDNYMDLIEDERNEHYGFRSNKGYGTERHLRALCVFGPRLDHHRLSFKPVAGSFHRPSPSPVFFELWNELGRTLDSEDRAELCAIVHAQTALLESNEAWLLSRRIEETVPFQPEVSAGANLRKVGSLHEKMVERHLEIKGLKILERNYYTRQGEIDLIALDGDRIVFIEVKMRKSDNYGAAAESVNPRKQRKMINAALDYLSGFPDVTDCRFDVIALDPDPRGAMLLDHLESAFDLADEGYS